MLRQDKMWGMMLKTHKMQVFSDMKTAIDFIQEQKKQWNLQSKESELRLKFASSEYIEPSVANWREKKTI